MKNFDELFEADEIKEFLGAKYRDPITKEIGDRVHIIDFSSVTNLNGDELENTDEDMQFEANTLFIVIDTHQRVKYDVQYMVYIQDIIIVNPNTKIQYRANSGHLILI